MWTCPPVRGPRTVPGQNREDMPVLSGMRRRKEMDRYDRDHREPRQNREPREPRENRESMDTLIYGKNPVAELLKSGKPVDLEAAEPAVAGA